MKQTKPKVNKVKPFSQEEFMNDLGDFLQKKYPDYKISFCCLSVTPIIAKNKNLLALTSQSKGSKKQPKSSERFSV